MAAVALGGDPRLWPVPGTEVVERSSVRGSPQFRDFSWEQGYGNTALSAFAPAGAWRLDRLRFRLLADEGFPVGY